jgi:hypothetical protein
MYEGSELALLMRAMHVEHDSLKAQILRGDSTLVIPASYKNMRTSKASDKMQIGDAFTQFSLAYDIAMDSLRQSERIDLTDNFNLAVKACVNCHELHCQGPIQRIEKLYILK